MRRVGAVAIVVATMVLGSVTPARAAPAPTTPPAATQAPGTGQQSCRVTDTRLQELSGMVATADGFVVITDSNSDSSRMKIFYLDATCKFKKQADYASVPRDPEDLAIQFATGTLWVADTGDNSASGGATAPRPNIALWKLDPSATRATIHRVAYPDNKPRDAEALLVKADGTPIIITKDSPAELYVPSAPLVANTTAAVKLQKVGTFTPERTGTPNRFPVIGEKVVTGAAMSPDGKKVVLRTYSDAHEFDVPDGDIVKAITTTKPRITPLPNEFLGEAITYTADGKAYLTISDGPVPQSMLRYAPATAPLAKPSGQAVPSPDAGEQSWLASLSLQQIRYIVIGVGILGLLLVAAGILGIRRSRKARRLAAGSGPVRGSAAVGRYDDDDDQDDDDDDDDARRRKRRRAGRSGRASAPAPPVDDDWDERDDGRGGGTVYGRPPGSASARGGGRGTVYGGGPAGGAGGADYDAGYDGYDGHADYAHEYDGYEQGYGRR